MSEQLLRDKISSHLPQVMKDLQLCDCNMDGKIAKQDLRKVLESYCFKFTDQLFDKLWQQYNLSDHELINYQDFLQLIGINTSHCGPALLQNTETGTFKWPKVTGQRKVMANHMKASSDDEKMILSMNGDQIEAEFRNRMRSNYSKLKKVFLAFDKNNSGYVSIEDLKSILHSFTLPMSDHIFLNLMNRCSVKASGRIAWEIFLEKFQSPVTIRNGKSLPIRPNHRIYPAMETKTAVDWTALWKELYRRVNSNYSTLKEAFLQIDKNRDGRVTKSEFRELIEKFTFHWDDEQFKELMLRIDPERRNQVDYQTFLRFFEDKETKEGHKWLKSVHKYNSKSKPAILAWKTVEDLLREKITFYWKNVSDWLKHYDSSGTGYLSKSTIKKIIDLQVLPVADDHFESLISRCTDFSVGKVNYMEFIQKLGVDVSPGDVSGLSSQVIDGSNIAERKRQLDQWQRHDQITMNQCHRSSQMTDHEVISLFKNKLPELTSELRKAFLRNDKQNKGHINQKQFQLILADLGILMSDEQLSELMSRLNMHNGCMQYEDFVNNFGHSRLQAGSKGVVEHLTNHRVNQARGDKYRMTAVEAEVMLTQKLRDNFSNLTEAFYKFDELHQGCLNKSNFRRMLDSFMIIMSDYEYDKFCDRLGIQADSKISYLQFISRFEQKDLLEGHKWLSSVHRFNKVYKPKSMTAAQGHRLLALKVYSRNNDLSQAFRSLSPEGNGIITKQELQDSLHKLDIPMEPAEFKQLWARLDKENKNYISHQDFLQRLATLEYATSDNGPSRSIFYNNYQLLKKNSQRQQEKHEDITWNQANLAMSIPVGEVERILRDKIRDSYSDFYTAFRKYDTNRLGVLSMEDIQKVLNQQHIFMNDEQFFAFMTRIGLPTYDSCINYTEFLTAFQDGHKSNYDENTCDVSVKKYHMLSPDDAEKKLKMILKVNSNDVSKALAAFDQDGSGKVPIIYFRRVLDTFCFVLTDPQWKYVTKNLNVTTDENVFYTDFMSQFGTRETDNNNNSRELFQLSQNDSSEVYATTPAVDDIYVKIHKAVIARYRNIMRDFENLDTAKIGCVTADEWREVIARHALKLNDEQFEKLSAVCLVTDRNQVNYSYFMKIFSEDMASLMFATPVTTDKPPSRMLSISPTRPATSIFQKAGPKMIRRSSSCVSRSSLRSSSRMSTPMVNAESAERLVMDIVFRYWREMQKQCREMDVNHSRTISFKQFNDLLNQYGVQLPSSDFHDLVTKYDTFENGRFCYGNFIRHFLLSLKPSSSKMLMNREKMQNKRIGNLEEAIEEDDDDAEDFQRRVQDCIQQNWKDMKRELRISDPESRGTVSGDEFRRALRKFNINISENEFHSLQERYSKIESDQINYNDFLKDNLHRFSK